MSSQKIKAVIFDWAGTSVDYGCIAPVQVFHKIFLNYNIHLSEEEIRSFMGLSKYDHILALLRTPSSLSQWMDLYQREPSDFDAKKLYKDFEPTLIESLSDPYYSTPLPGFIQTIACLKAMGIKIGSTTGYTKKMIDTLAPAAAHNGYKPDVIVTSEDFPSGRPAPWMIFENARQMNVYPMKDLVKVGDTISDIYEGKNANCISVGVIEGSNELGLSLEEKENLDPKLFQDQCQKVRQSFIKAGADFVLQSIHELPGLIKALES